MLGDDPEHGSCETVVVSGDDLDRAIEHYLADGFVLNAIGPADEPAWAELSAAELSAAGLFDTERRIVLSVGGAVPQPGPDLHIPDTAQSFVIQHERQDGWISGRAGMLYRDLIPNRYGGAYIASHIHIPEGGPVPDYVHHHDVAHQMIFVHRGWVRVVYQDQGQPFVMNPGDCVLQPPGIRHQVLEASDDLFVVEITCPAEHRTSLDHELVLPTMTLDENRRYGRGQRFVRHDGSRSSWIVAGDPNEPVFEEQVTGLSGATDSLVAVRVLRTVRPQISPFDLCHDDDLLLLFMIDGSGGLLGPTGDVHRLSTGSSVAIPAAEEFALVGLEPDSRLLEVRGRRP